MQLWTMMSMLGAGGGARQKGRIMDVQQWRLFNAAELSVEACMHAWLPRTEYSIFTAARGHSSSSIAVGFPVLCFS
jgi:hypothetical protein